MAAAPASEVETLPNLLTSRRASFERGEELPEEYPKSLRVRNTFIDTSAERSPSLDAFYREREVSTCPSSDVGKLRGLFQDLAIGGGAGPRGRQALLEEDAEPQVQGASAHAGEKEPPPSRAEGARPAAVLSLAESLAGHQERPREEMVTVAAAPVAALPLQAAAAPFAQKPAFCLTAGGICQLSELYAPYALGVAPMQALPTAAAAAIAAPATAVPVAALIAAAPVAPITRAVGAEAAPSGGGGGGRGEGGSPRPPQGGAKARGLKSATLGTPEMPSVGSVGHAAGRCKPCAFYHTKGCSNDITCQFCHLCDADEKKRRRREKFETRRAAHQLRSELYSS